MDQAKLYLKQAEEGLRKGDCKHAVEKVWGAAALAIKAHALTKEGKRLCCVQRGSCRGRRARSE